jgi:carboxymethylenebutenolidase
MADHDLVALWETHCRYEFEIRDVAATMATMVAEPYVNHIPTMTGGVGHEALKRFYADHFIGANPPDLAMTPVSRTVGSDRVVDEFVVSFTRSRSDRTHRGNSDDRGRAVPGGQAGP